MNKTELKLNHPELYAEIMQEGVDQERSRVEAWAVYNEVNPAKVKAGIESGNDLTSKQMAEFSLEIAQGQKLENLEYESPKKVEAPAKVKSEAELKEEAQKADMDKLFNDQEA
jgi:hypothetical protein